jgi:hypothetical protein
MFTRHALHERRQRLQAFSLSAGKIATLLRKVADLAPTLSNYLLIVARSDVIVQCADGSNGDLLCALVRDRKAVTVLLRRTDQITRLDGLPYVALTRDDTLEIL